MRQSLSMFSRFAKLSVVVAALACGAISYAGFDGWFVASKVTGKAQARQLVRKNGRKIWTPWHDVQVGDKIDPPSEIVTFDKSSLWIESGTRLQDPSKMRVDETVNTTELGPNTFVKTHGASLNGPKILEVVHGIMRSHVKHGKLPAWKASIPITANSSITNSPKLALKSSVSSMSLTFEPGMVNHPVWRAITLRSDGTGTSWLLGMDGKGTFRLKGLNREFNRLARMIDDVHYSDLEMYYGEAVFDIPVTTISVLFSNKRKSIVDWGKPFQPTNAKEAPEKLKRIEKALLDLCTSLHWEKVSSKVDFPTFMPSTDGRH